MELLRDTPFEVAFVVTPLRPPRPTLTVVVKATLTLPTDGVCAIADAQQPVSADVHEDDDPARPLRYESDLAPAKPCGEVLVLGRCHPRGGAATQSAVAFSVGAVKKRIAVFGDRRWGAWPLRSIGAPASFKDMPLTWERARGGDPRNPIGRAGVDAPLPNLEDPDALIRSPDDARAPAGCGPIARTWSARTRFAGTYDAAWQRDRWPFLPADHDLAYHLAAPADQRIAGYWSGDEEITLRNMHPAQDLVRARLPDLSARVFVVRRAGGDPEAIRMRLDTLVVDAEACRVTLLWRGNTDVASDRLEDLHTLVVWHEPSSARGDVEGARARIEAARAKERAEDAAFAPEPVPADAPSPAVTPAEAPEEVPEDVRQGIAEALAQIPDDATQQPAPTDEALQGFLRDAGIPADALRDEVPAEAPTVTDPVARARLLAALAAGEPTAGMDLSAADLSGLDLKGCDLTRCILSGATLTGCALDGAKLAGAALTGATLRGASLRRADLTRADLTGASGDDVVLEGATLDGAVLGGTSLRGADLRGASLRGTEAREADLTRADLTGATLDGATLDGATLVEVRAAGASFARASLEGAKAAGADLTGADLTRLRASERTVLRGATLREAKGPHGIFTDADLTDADLSFADLTRAELSGARLDGACLDGCALRHARFIGASLKGARALRADAMEASFEGADLAGADLRGASLYGAQLWKARVHGARFDQCLLGGTLLASFASTLGAR